MHDEHLTARIGERADEIAHEIVVLRAVDADAVLDRDGYADGVLHRFHAVGHEAGLGHQAGAEGAPLHPLARTTAVQVDFVVAPALAEPRAGGQFGRLAATELQGKRVLRLAEVEVARHVAMQQSAGRHHLGVEPRAARELAVEVTAVPIGPVHHRGHAQAPGVRFVVHAANCRTRASRALACLPAASTTFAMRGRTACRYQGVMPAALGHHTPTEQTSRSGSTTATRRH